MIDFIKDNALIFIAIGSFIILVAIGFIVDTYVLSKKKKSKKVESDNVVTTDAAQVTESKPEAEPTQEEVLSEQVIEEDSQVNVELPPVENVQNENQMSSDDIEEVNESPFTKTEDTNDGSSPWEV